MKHRDITVPDPEYKRFASAIQTVRQRADSRTAHPVARVRANVVTARSEREVFFESRRQGMAGDTFWRHGRRSRSFQQYCKFQSFSFTIRPRLSRIGRAVYVCLCNRVTDRELVEAATAFASEPETGASASFAERVADRLGAGLGCGTCREFALDLVEWAATRRSMVVLPDCVAASPGLEVPLAGRCSLSFQHVAPRSDEAVASQGD